MKYVLLCYLALVGQVIFPRIFGAQQKVHPSDPIKTEDQMLAEAMWRLAGLDAEKDVRADDVFDEVSKAFPRSAKVAYWHAKFRALDGQQVEVLQKIVDFSQSLQQQMNLLQGRISQPTSYSIPQSFLQMRLDRVLEDALNH